MGEKQEGAQMEGCRDVETAGRIRRDEVEDGGGCKKGTKITQVCASLLGVFPFLDQSF